MTITSGRRPAVLAVDQVDHVQRVPWGAGHDPMPASPTAWSVSRFSHVAPRRRPKYFGLGRAWMLRTGTTNRIPSTAGDQAAAPRLGEGDVGLGVDQRGVGGGVSLRPAGSSGRRG